MQATKDHRIIRSVLTKVFLLLACLAILGCGVRICWVHWIWLSERGIEGLFLMQVLAWALATLATPFFAHGMTQDPSERPGSSLEVIKLYLGVGGITFVALSVAFLLFWLWALLATQLREVWNSLWCGFP